KPLDIGKGFDQHLRLVQIHLLYHFFILLFLPSLTFSCRFFCSVPKKTGSGSFLTSRRKSVFPVTWSGTVVRVDLHIIICQIAAPGRGGGISHLHVRNGCN